MLSILHFFHDTLKAPYGLAIILLTVVVRLCLFPVSRKMAENQQKMKELQPKMQEIRTKYKDDQEKMAQAMQNTMFVGIANRPSYVQHQRCCAT